MTFFSWVFQLMRPLLLLRNIKLASDNKKVPTSGVNFTIKIRVKCTRTARLRYLCNNSNSSYARTQSVLWMKFTF